MIGSPPTDLVQAEVFPEDVRLGKWKLAQRNPESERAVPVGLLSRQQRKLIRTR